MRRPQCLAVLLSAAVLAGCAEGAFLDTPIDKVIGNHTGLVCYHPKHATVEEVEAIARQACWDAGRRLARLEAEQRFQCRMSAPSQVQFRCIDQRAERRELEARLPTLSPEAAARAQSEADARWRRLLPPPDGQ